MAIAKLMPEPIVEESVEVAPSEDNGNVPAETVAPITPPSEPPKETPSTPAATTEPELFELPDGRKVDAVTLSKEFKENFLPDYTRKSQELAQLKGPKEISKDTPKNPLEDPEYIPQTYGELAKIIRESTLQEIATREQQAEADRLAVENTVNEQLNAVKAIDKTVNENALFHHATKYGFRDLRQAHQNMTDMARLAKSVKETTAKDVLKRNDPVNIIPGSSGGARPDASAFSTARDFLRSLQ